MKATRGGFLASAGAVGAGLAIGIDLHSAGAEAASGDAFAPNAFLTIGSDDRVTVFVVKSEMGQGVLTALPQLVAEELDYPFDRITVEQAPVDPAHPNQSTGGSTSVKTMYLPMRKAGASARALLIAAAAKDWNVDSATLTTARGEVLHAASGKRATYGSLAASAATLTPPADVPLKAAANFTVIGKPVMRTDVPAKSRGKAIYGLDVRVPGMLYAMIARPPAFGGSVKSFDAAKAKRVKGVVDVVKLTSGIAVVATNTFAARQGRDALSATFDSGPNGTQSSAKIAHEAAELVKKPGTVAVKTGDAAAQLAAAHTVLRATYTGPFLAHATMEPMNATAWLHDGGLELWLPTQAPSSAQTAAATTAGLDPAKVTVHTTLLGGGFGRRFETDFTIEAAELALKTGGKPVKVVWSREDDIQHDVYRPASTNAVAAALDANGRIVAYQSTIASPSILRRVFPNAVPKGGVDRISVNGVANLLYDVPNLTVDYHEHDTGIPVGFWRAPGANWNAYVTESFMDELAHAAKADPYAFRRAHLQKNPRALAVLDRAAMLGGWGKPLPAGVHRGIALCIWDGSYAAAVADITMAGNALRVQRIATAVDVGQIVNPAILTMQIESGVMYGLSAAMNGKITIEKGAVKQNNFYDYFVLRNDRAPRVEVALMPSTETPTGAGEVGTPAVAPAIGNAIFAATGKRIRSLPFDDTIKLA